jgi:hypothetical protein
MTTLFVVWRDPKDKAWLPIGRLCRDRGVYRFRYTKGASKSRNFVPFARMEDRGATYESDELFPVFATRLLSPSRPDYAEFTQWAGLEGPAPDSLELLARTGGIRETDSLALFPEPEPTPDGCFRMHFFAHGLRYFAAPAIGALRNIQSRDPLFLMLDEQNAHDPEAILMRTGDPVTCAGYCPRYLAHDLRALLRAAGPSKVSTIVIRANLSAPTDLRLLCRVTALWPDGFKACASEEYGPAS